MKLFLPLVSLPRLDRHVKWFHSFHPLDSGILAGRGTEEVAAGATLLGEPLPVELMNTVGTDRGGVRDALDSDAGTAAWLRAVADRIGAEAGTEPGQSDADAVRQVAGALRELRDAGPPVPRLSAGINQVHGIPRTARRMSGQATSPAEQRGR